MSLENRYRAPLWCRILAAPFIALAFLTYNIGRGIYLLSELYAWIARTWGAHVYYVFVQLRRWALGESTWQVVDLSNGLQPRTDTQIAFARAQADVVEVKCDCGEPDCDLAKRLRSQPHFLHRLQHALINPDTQQRLSRLVNSEIDKIMKVPAPPADGGDKKMDGLAQDPSEKN